jgi:chromosome segregation ATPase
MEAIEGYAGLGGLTICALVLLFVARALFNKSADTPALATSLMTVAQALKDQSNDSQEERKAWNQLITTIASEMRQLRTVHEQHEAEESRRETQEIARHEAILAGFQEVVKALNGNKEELHQLVAKVDHLDNTMNQKLDQHMDERPAILDELREIKQMIIEQNQRLSAFVSNTTREANEMKQELVQTTGKVTALEKRITTETPAVPAVETPPETISQTGTSKTAARRSTKTGKNLEPTSEADETPGGDPPQQSNLKE